MSSGRWDTHTIEMAADHVIKRFPSKSDGHAEREWRALILLATHAPGLAPVPVEVNPAAAKPFVVMSRLAGAPLRGTEMGSAEIEALADAVATLHDAVPSDVVGKIPLRPGRQGELIGHLDVWAATDRHEVRGVVRRAMETGLAWLARSGLDTDASEKVPAVFGAGDGNLANYLWDGSRVQVVDFEDSGRSDRALELAEITEHVGSWVEQPLDVATFLDRFDLSPVETTRLRECRRLLALVWLFLLMHEDPEHPRNPPGTAELQADRLLALLA